MSELQLGCGLIAIGRPWGVTPEVPSDTEAQHFLDDAYESGIRFFDTAPSYGVSEARLGTFLNRLTTSERRTVTVATKFGEQWDEAAQTGVSDHSLEGLQRSLDTSLQHLGQIAIIQLHKTTPELLRDESVLEAFAYAKSLGVPEAGVSANDETSLAIATNSGSYEWLQTPYNQEWSNLDTAIATAVTAGLRLMINRPIQMGKALTDTTPHTKHDTLVSAYRYIQEKVPNGVVLTGTSNGQHLHENIAAFVAAVN